MTIAVVRLVGEGCAADCPEFIAAQGVVQTDSHRRFKAVLASLQGRRLPVWSTRRVATSMRRCKSAAPSAKPGSMSP